MLKGKTMFLIVGLGNTGVKYQNTYHNVGFMCVDKLAKKYGFSITKKRGNALIFEGKLNGKKVIVAKPQTYMNLSGLSVWALVKKFKISPENILIIYDDIDTNIGDIRYRNSGSAGTHNGMKDVIKMLNNGCIKRLRIGVSKELMGSQSLADYVLSSVRKEHTELLEKGLEKGVELVENFIEKSGEVENKSM
jgi:PTH1 family peptidyl-tRNA hydrolase